MRSGHHDKNRLFDGSKGRAEALSGTFWLATLKTENHRCRSLPVCGDLILVRYTEAVRGSWRSWLFRQRVLCRVQPALCRSCLPAPWERESRVDKTAGPLALR